MIKIYNSLTRKKELLQPIKSGHVGMYVCGITSYDYCHIGHGRTYVAFDVIKRYLNYRGYQVTYVRNITDVDDKIINRAQKEGVEPKALAEKFIKTLHEDEQALGISPPDIEPRATEYIPQMIDMIQALINKNYAYIADNGDVCYRVNRFENYGQLSRKDIEGLRAGARVNIVDAKQDPLDFVLWKLAKPGEPQWSSPWGAGRPGWHIECSAMSTECLGNHFDIHGGGFDLQFPHHENEIAQSEGATEEKFVNVWMHSGLVHIDKEKMSKSLGNYFTVREVLAKYPAEVIRFFMIAGHYRSPVNYSLESLNLAQASLERLYTSLLDSSHEKEAPANSEFEEKFMAAMDDDFNTPLALSILFDLGHEINRLAHEDIEKAASLRGLLKKLGLVLGILQQEPQTFRQRGVDEAQIQTIEKLIKERDEARRDRAWQVADQIRDQLLAMGIILEDKSDRTVWRIRE